MPPATTRSAQEQLQCAPSDFSEGGERGLGGWRGTRRRGGKPPTKSARHNGSCREPGRGEHCSSVFNVATRLVPVPHPPQHANPQKLVPRFRGTPTRSPFPQRGRQGERGSGICNVASFLFKGVPEQWSPLLLPVFYREPLFHIFFDLRFS